MSLTALAQHPKTFLGSLLFLTCQFWQTTASHNKTKQQISFVFSMLCLLKISDRGEITGNGKNDTQERPDINLGP